MAAHHGPATDAAAASAAPPPGYWLLKNEPDPHVVQGYDLASPYAALAARRISLFTGVRNGRAKNYMRDAIRPGDLALWYHSSPRVGPPGVAGIARILAVVPDDDALNPKHPMYDVGHTTASPKWFALRCEAVRPMARYLSLHELKAHATAPAMSDMLLFKVPRLSVQPVSAAAWDYIMGLESGGGGGGSAGGGDDGSSTAKAPAAKRRRKGGVAHADSGGSSTSAAGATAAGDSADGHDRHDDHDEEGVGAPSGGAGTSRDGDDGGISRGAAADAGGGGAAGGAAVAGRKRGRGHRV